MPITVTVVIPCRNEEKLIGKCLDSVVNQDFPKEDLEVLVVDGMSGDRTREIVEEFSQKYHFIRLLENPDKTTPFALNTGIRNSHGGVIVRMDAHAGYSGDYVSKCYFALNKYGADNVGGTMKIMPNGPSFFAKAIAYVLSSPFGSGNAYYKTSSSNVAQEVDTVFCGCFRKGIFDKVGLFDERMTRSQDYELNERIRRAGGKIMLVPGIVSYYYPKPDLGSFLKHYFDDGFWVIYSLKFGVKAFSWRHLMPLFFVLGLLGLFLLGFIYHPFWWLLAAAMISYFALNVFFSTLIIAREKNFPLFGALFLVFFARHFFYGLGSLWALIKIPFSFGKK